MKATRLWTALAATVALGGAPAGAHAALRASVRAHAGRASGAPRTVVAATTYEGTDTLEGANAAGAEQRAQPPPRPRRSVSGNWVPVPDDKVEIDSFPILPGIVSALKERGITQFTAIQVCAHRAAARARRRARRPASGAARACSPSPHRAPAIFALSARRCAERRVRADHGRP